jgi:sugar phosphate isomerase/epimerase
MQLGICTSIAAAKALPASLPIDFIEENVQSLLKPQAADADFETVLADLHPAFPVSAANCFLPAALKATGAFVDEAALDRYAAAAFARAGRVGIRTIVFGSGGSRALAEGFPKPTAVAQFIELLRRLGSLAEPHGVTVVVEPLNSGECNFINSLAEGAKLVQAAAHPNVRLLADIFHMLRDKESAEELVRFGHLLHHVHVAENKDRACPGTNGEDFRPYFQALRKVGYEGPLSIECNWVDLAAQAEGAVAELRRQLADCGF